MRLLRRIIVTTIITLVAIFTAVRWAADVAFTFDATRKAPAVARVVPTDMKDQTVSQAPGAKLSYIGYEFEVPWTDLDESKTEQYPKNKPEKTLVFLTFRSGLRLRMTAISPGEWARHFATDMKLSPQQYERFVGHEAAMSDYAFIKSLYEFTPEKMHHWAWSPAIHAREEMMLMFKSIAPTKAAESGIFNVQNTTFKGFQQGEAEIRQDYLFLSLYSEDGSVEIMFLQKDFHNPTGVTQPEINRIVQSLHKAAQSPVATSTN